MIRIAKRLSKKWLLAVALVATGGLVLGTASTAEANTCYGRGYGGGFGAYGPAPVVVSRPVPGFGYGGRYGGYGYSPRSSFYRGYGGFGGYGYGGRPYGGRGISIGFGF